MEINRRTFKNRDVVFVELDIKEYDDRLWMKNVIVGANQFMHKNNIPSSVPLVVANPYERIIYNEIR